MGFMDSYKRLEKLCGDMLEDERRISAYIDKMYENTEGWDLVDDWESDLKNLKYYRRIRNKLVHEPDAYEEELCDTEDVEWLEDFYYRIIDGEDPLSRYYKIVRARNSTNNASRYGMDTSSYGTNSNSSYSYGKIGTFLLALFFTALILFIIPIILDIIL